MIIYNHIFDEEKILNFIDERGFVLSYECFNLPGNKAGWFLSVEVAQESLMRQPSLRSINQVLKTWRFDPSWYDELEYLEPDDIDPEDEDDLNILDNGTMAVFKVVNTTGRYQEKFIHIYNCHNGHSLRHFDFSDKRDEMIESGDL